MWIAAAFVTTISFGTNNAIFKWSTAKGLSKLHIQFCFYLIAFLITLSYGIMEGLVQFNLLTILLGSLIGILNANGNIQMSKAFEKGPASLTSPLIAVNAIFPILGAGLIFHEQISTIQWIGVIIMLGSAFLIQYAPNSSGNIHYLPWIFRVLLAIMSFGGLALLMKTSAHLHINSLSILICMYGGGTVYLGICIIKAKEKWLKKEVNIGLLAGLVSIIGYSSYFFALNTGIASIVFPIVSLNCIVVIFVGYCIFKEKLKIYQVVGVITALIGVVFTKI